jgi:hypothetical protein
MLKIKKKSPTCKFCVLDEFTREQIKDIGRFLEYSEAEVIKLLVSQYYKMQVIEHEDDEGYMSMEFIPFFETQESYKQFKEQYAEEYGFEYSAVVINKENYHNYIPEQT